MRVNANVLAEILHLVFDLYWSRGHNNKPDFVCEEHDEEHDNVSDQFMHFLQRVC